GAERQLAYLAHGMVKAGIGVHIGYLGEGHSAQRLASSGAILHKLTARGSLDPLLIPRILQLVVRVRPDLIHTWFRQMDILGGTAAIAMGIPWVLGERSSSAAYPPNWKHALRCRIASKATVIVANSFKGLEYWQFKLRRTEGLRVIQ